MNNLRLFFNILIILLCLTACRNRHPQTVTDNTTRLSIDTLHPEKTFNVLRNTPASQVDLTYEHLYHALAATNRYALLEEHMQYYTRLNAHRQNSEALLALARGYACNYNAQYDSANYYFDYAIMLYRHLDKPGLLCNAYMGKAVNAIYQSDYAQAFTYHYKALSVYEQEKDAANIYQVKTDICIDYYYQKEYKKAISLAEECLSYYAPRNDRQMTAYLQTIMATCYYNIPDYERSLRYSDSSLYIRRRLNVPRDIAESLNNQALALMGLERWQEAIRTLRESLQLMQQAGDQRQIPIIEQNLASCLIHAGEHTTAKKMIEEVITVAGQSGQKDVRANAYRKMYSIYKDEQNFERALHFYQRYKQLRDSIYNDEKAKTISELNIRYETRQKEQKIARLDMERKLEHSRKLSYLLALGLLLTLAFILIMLLANRNRKHRAELEKARAELKVNETDLASFTANIISKNKFIEELEQQIQQILMQPAAQPVTNMHDEYLSQLYQFKILTDEDWANFKIKFDKAYPGFINKLRDKYPELAPGEQRLFLLIKLNISNRECADMLGISAESIKKNRYRLKKRFNLGEQETLDDFVRSFN